MLPRSVPVHAGMDMSQRPNRTTPAAPPLAPEQMRTLALTSLGGALELFDFVIFVYFVPTLAQVFFPPALPPWLAELQTFTVFAVGYFARPVGGVLIAHFGDRIGRKRTFNFTLTLMALATLAMACLPTYADWGLAAPLLLSLLRLVQGIAVGGEVSGGYLFGAEHVADARRGSAMGIIACGMTFGVLLGVLVAMLIHMMVPEADILDVGWRIAFAIGGGLGLACVLLRKSLDETPVFRALKAEDRLARDLPIRTVMRHHGRDVVVSVLAFWPFIAHFAVLSLMGPTLLQTLYRTPPVTALFAGCLATAGLIMAAPISGLMFDRLGQARALGLVAAVALMCDLACFLLAPGHPELRAPLMGLAGFGGGLFGAASVIMIRSFPPPVAYSGVSLSLNLVSGIVAGLTPMGISAALPVLPSAPLWYLAAACAAAFSLAWWLRARERAART